jgi:hypothetical protein
MEEIIQLGNRIRKWQVTHGLSDTEVCRRYSGLGSTKTYKKVIAGDLDGLDIDDKWLPEYRAVWSLMEYADQAGVQDEPDYDDLTNVTRARLAAMHAMQERGNNRLVIMEGPPGSGKSTALRCMAAKFGRNLVRAEADELWQGSLGVMLGALLRAVNVLAFPVSPEARKLRLLEKLRKQPCCLAIDDAHHCGPRNLNLFKTIINQTACQIILCGVDSLMKRMMGKEPYEETRQLNNRLCERVRFEPPRASDVEKFCDRRGVNWTDAKTAAKCCQSLASRAAEMNYWNFINRVVRALKEMDGPIDDEAFTQALKGVARAINGQVDL